MLFLLPNTIACVLCCITSRYRQPSTTSCLPRYSVALWFRYERCPRLPSHPGISCCDSPPLYALDFQLYIKCPMHDSKSLLQHVFQFEKKTPSKKPSCNPVRDCSFYNLTAFCYI